MGWNGVVRGEGLVGAWTGNETGGRNTLLPPVRFIGPRSDGHQLVHFAVSAVPPLGTAVTTLSQPTTASDTLWVSMPIPG